MYLEMKTMKYLFCAAAVLMSAVCTTNCQGGNSEKVKNNPNMQTKKILFINGSPNKEGNTAELAKQLLEGQEYETITLTEYRINFYGQTAEGDQFEEVFNKMKQADIVVMGSPVYWHNICASLRTFMERLYDVANADTFKGKQLFFLYQGAGPSKKMIDDGEYTMKRFATLYGFSYEGMANNTAQAKALRSKL